MQDLVGRVAWITGAASGIGLALAHKLAAEKMKLVLVDVAPIDEAAFGTEVLAIRANVASGDAVAAAAEQAQKRFGVVHLIINNAGIGGAAGPMWQLSEQEWKATLDINLWGVVHGIRALLPPLLASGEVGHVVNTASMAGMVTTPFMGPYTASKFAVVSMSECLAKELELSRAKVGVSVLCPGFVKTNIAGKVKRGDRVGEVVAQLVASGQSPDRVADAVVAAVRESRFYVLTHPEMKPQIEHRMRQILEEKQPGMDPMIRSLLAP
jgi:NAD(P)-dependent dehydrogenase (short-subunit alcohol dehydrogenase family)